jgi:Lamin Tail Domain
VKARARTGGGEWSGVNGAYFVVGSQPPSATNVVFSEVHYHPAPPTRTAELAISSDPDEFEFIELMNIGPTTVDFTGAHLGAGLVFDFPVGYALTSGARCVVVRNQAAFEARYGTGRAVAGVFGTEAGLGNSGDTLALTLTDAGNVTTTLRSFTYDDAAPWPAAPDGDGPSLVLKNPTTNPDHNVAGNWVASADFGGTPAQAPAEMTFNQWRNGFGGTLVATGDDDGDGLRNDLEYALALNPLVRNTNVLPAAQLINVGGQFHLAITFRHRPAADLATMVQSSETLDAWSAAPSVVLESSSDHGDGSFTETWRCATPVGGAGAARQFLRIHTTLTF